MGLERVSALYGTADITQASPRIGVVEDVLYVPPGMGEHRPGLYAADGSLIPGAGYRRGVPTPHLPVEAARTALRAADFPFAAEGVPLLYAGHLTGHYGHFLFACLARLWCLPYARDPLLRLLVIRDQPIGHAFARPFLRGIFDQLGIAEPDLLRFDAPVRLRSLTLPWPAAEENLGGHAVFGRLCARIGWSATNNLTEAPAGAPVYLSKLRLALGVHRIINEAELCAALEQRGVEIVFPETLSFARQVALFRGRRLLMGFAGSALHTGVFAGGKRCLALSPEPRVSSSQVILDRVSGGETMTMYPQGGIDPAPPPPGFSHGWMLTDPAGTAAAMLGAAETFGLGRAGAGRDAAKAAAKAPRPPAARVPAGPGSAGPALPTGARNLALGCPALQSSICADSRGADLASDAAGGVSGRITGGYQFHTGRDRPAWWQVDLRQRAAIDRVVLFNRLDAYRGRASRFVLKLSDDGESWREAARRDSEAAFGGQDGAPFVWEPDAPALARFVRVERLERGFLHLDQVEVHGVPAPNSASSPDGSNKDGSSKGVPSREGAV